MKKKEKKKKDTTAYYVIINGDWIEVDISEEMLKNRRVVFEGWYEEEKGV